MRGIIASFLFLLTLTEGKSSCNYSQNLESGKLYYAYNREFPNQYKGENHCTWQTFSSDSIKINCSLDIPESPDCSKDRLSIKFIDQTDESKYCGYGTLDLKGKNATISLYSPYSSLGGKFLCEIRAEKDVNCQCGWKKVTKTPRIVGGSTTGVNEYPMMAGLVDSIQKEVYCGATIISHEDVITAAHCIEHKNLKKIGVVIGEHDTLTGHETNATKLYRIIQCVIHPQYNDLQYDVAICRVDGKINYSAEVGPVCLPFQHRRDSFGGEIVTALGWGLLAFGGAKSKDLQKVNLNVINLAECKHSDPRVEHSNICTYTPGKDSCQMDSGGPILWQNPTTHNLILVGIMSSGIGCASDEPSVAMRVGAFVDWIVKVTSDVKYCKVE